MKTRKGFYFNRGVHVPDRKSLAENAPIETFDAPDVVCISLSQHIGKPAEAVVAVGDSVLRGQLIGKETGFVSANVYASVSGEIIALEKRPNPRGGTSECVVIRNDGENLTTHLPPMEEKTPQALIARIREAGIVGMGGAGFPTAVKLSPPPTAKVDTLILNAAECEPYLTCDYRLMIEKTDEVVAGLRLLARALGVEKIVVGVEKNKPRAIELFQKYEDLQVVVLKKAYPMGSEKHLIYSCTRRKVPTGKLPADAGCVVQNVATAYACYEAIERNKPLYERVLTVSGNCVGTPRNLLVPFGTSFDKLYDFCGLKRDNLAMLICGGPMMGTTMLSSDYQTTKTTSGLLALDNTEIDFRDPTPCINCGRCANVCPMKLMPMSIDFYTQAGDYESAKKYGGVMNCIECGSCSYVCPARRALLQSITLCKAKLREMK